MRFSIVTHRILTAPHLLRRNNVRRIARRRTARRRRTSARLTRQLCQIDRRQIIPIGGEADIEHGSKDLQLATILVCDARRFDLDRLSRAVDALIGTREPVARAATLTVEPDPFVSRVRSGRGVGSHTGTDLRDESYAVALIEAAVGDSSVAQALDCVGLWAAGCSI